MQETWVRFLGWEDPWRRGRLPTPVFWPGEFHGLCSPWGCTESDTTEQLSLSLYCPLLPSFLWWFLLISLTFKWMQSTIKLVPFHLHSLPCSSLCTLNVSYMMMTSNLIFEVEPSFLNPVFWHHHLLSVYNVTYPKVIKIETLDLPSKPALTIFPFQLMTTPFFQSSNPKLCSHGDEKRRAIKI